MLTSWGHLNLYERKRLLRRQILALRNSKPTEELDGLSSKIAGRLLELPEMKSSRTVSTYLDTGSEVRTKEIVKQLLSESKRVVVPITDKPGKRLVFSELKDPEKELEPGTFGILEPTSEFRRPVRLDEADAVLVPGIVWDLRGYRIGYGAGYYDRSINALRKPILKIGLSYEFQIVQRVPISRHDRRVDRIVTEFRVMNTRATVP